MVPAPAQGKDLERTRRAFPGRLEYRHPALRIRRRAHPAPGPVQSRPGPHQSPARPGPGPRPRHRPDVHLARRGQARHPYHRRPAQRQPGSVPAAEPGHRLDAAEHRHHVGQPQMHRVHGLRPPPQPQRPPHSRPARPMAVVPRTRPPCHHPQGHLAASPGHRRRAQHQPRRRRPEHPPRHGPVLPLPRPRPLPGLPTPHGWDTYRKPTSLSSYYRCPHNWANPKHAADHPDHPRSVQAPETRLDQIVGEFFATRVFGSDRAALLAAQLPATDAQAIADRDAQESALRARIARIEAAQDSKIIELEQLPANPDDTAAQAYRARIRARFAELHHEREQVEAQLKDLAKTTPTPRYSTSSPWPATSCPACRPGSRPVCSPPSTSRYCGTSPASKPPCAPRSPKPPCKPHAAYSTPPRTATTTPTPTGPNQCGIWTIPLEPVRCHTHWPQPAPLPGDIPGPGPAYGLTYARRPSQRPGRTPRSASPAAPGASWPAPTDQEAIPSPRRSRWRAAAPSRG